jgi:hypothetical protein
MYKIKWEQTGAGKPYLIRDGVYISTMSRHPEKWWLTEGDVRALVEWAKQAKKFDRFEMGHGLYADCWGPFQGLIRVHIMEEW